MSLSRLLAVCPYVLLVACTSTGVIPLGQGTYMISKKDGSIGVGISHKNKAEVYQEAAEFCESKGMGMKEVKVQVIPSVPMMLGSTELHFKCADTQTGDSIQLREIKQKCSSEFQNTIGLDPIRKMIPEFAQDATLSQRANNKKPNAVEKGALEVLDQVQTVCRENILNYYANNGAPPDLRVAMTNNMANQRELLMSLWSGKLTYGEYAQKRITSNQQYQAVYAKIMNVERDKADARAESQAKIAIARQESEARVAAVQQAADAQSSMATTQQMMLMNQQQTQQRSFNLPGSLGNPVRTNCTNIGGSVNCQTYSY